MNSLNLGVSLETSLAKLTTNTTLLDTTEWHTEVAIIAAVDPDHTGLDLRGGTVSTLNVLGEKGSAETVSGIVGTGDSLLLGDKAGDDNEGTEDLLAVDAHVILNTGEDGRGNEESTAVADVLEGLAASDEGSALGLAGLNVRKNTVVLCLSDLRTLEGVVGEGVTDLASGGCNFLEERDELIVHRVVNQDTGGRSADLALVIHDTDVGPLSSLLKVGILKHNQWGLASGLEGNVLKGASSHLHNLTTSGSGASESNLVNIGVLHQRSTSHTTVTVNDVNDTGRETSLLDQTSQVKNAKRGLLGSLHNNSVTTCEGRAQLPGSHSQREVPGDDLANHTNGLAQSVGELLGGGVDSLASHLVGPAGGVTERTEDFTEIIVEGNRVRLACFQFISFIGRFDIGDKILTVVPGLNGGEGLLVLLNQVGKLEHQVTTVGSGQSLPGRVLQGLACGLDSDINILLTSGINGSDLRLVPETQLII